MTTDHGNSIITKLRLIIERMQIAGDCKACDNMRGEAENILALDNVDDVELIILREAASVLNGLDRCDLADKVERAAIDHAVAVLRTYANEAPRDPAC